MRSLNSFVGDLPDELLLCPVRALRAYLARTSSLLPRPRTLFVSPRSTARSLSKNALSFFLRDIISRAYSSFQRLLLLRLLELILSVGWLLPGLLPAMLPCLLC